MRQSRLHAVAEGAALRKRERDQFKKMLLELRRRVSGDLGGLTSEARRENRTKPSGDDHAGAGLESLETELNFNLIELEQSEMKEISLALERIEDATYGKCEGCKGAIQLRRLQAKPFARLCIDCKRKEEDGQS